MSAPKPSLNIRPILRPIKPILAPTPIPNPTSIIKEDPANASTSQSDATSLPLSETNTEAENSEEIIMPSIIPKIEKKIRVPVADPKTKLLPYQVPHVDNLVYSLNLYGRVLDSSDTGVGKTYSSIATCMILGLKPFIICPKSVLSSWRKALDHFGAFYYGMSNYETLQNCKYFSEASGDKKLPCNFIERTDLRKPLSGELRSTPATTSNQPSQTNQNRQNSQTNHVGPTSSNPFGQDYQKSIHGKLVNDHPRRSDGGYRLGDGTERYGNKNYRDDHRQNKYGPHGRGRYPKYQALAPQDPPKSGTKHNFDKIDQNPEEDDIQRDYIYKWVNLPGDICLIFDETHRCKNARTVNHAILEAAANTPAKIMMLSATVCDKPENFPLCGYVLGLYNRKRDAKSWIEKANRICEKDVITGMPENSTSNIGRIAASSDPGDAIRYFNPMAGVHAKIFPEHAARMRIQDLGDAFPENQVLAQCYDMNTANEIEEQYKLIEEEVARLKKAEQRSQCFLAQILYARMRIEQLKIPTILELAKKYREDGLALAIFVNFTMTLKTLADELGTRCLIYGEQSLEERDKAIKDFEDDKEHIIICNIRSGGVGVSLHDIHGNFPRMSIISPSWSAQDIIQALGRIHRANGKSKVRQRIVFCKGTIEEDICEKMKVKIENIAALNDGNLDNYKIEGLTDDNLLEGLDTMPELTEYEILCQKIETLTTRKARLKEDLKQVKTDLTQLRQELAQVVRKKHENRFATETNNHKYN